MHPSGFFLVRGLRSTFYFRRRCQPAVSPAIFATCAACFSLRAAFRVCHDFCSVFGFGFSLLRDSRGVTVLVVVDAMVLFHFYQGRAGPVSQ